MSKGELAVTGSAVLKDQVIFLPLTSMQSAHPESQVFSGWVPGGAWNNICKVFSTNA